jgi:competence protein ComEC
LFASIKSGLLVDVRARGSAASELAARIRGRTRRAIARWVSSGGAAVTEPGPRDATAAAIVTAVLIGDRAGIADDVRERLQAAGTYHVIAISGGNIAMFVVLVVGALRVAGFSGRPSAVAALAVLAVYGQVASAGPSVWRATVMASLHLATRALDHQSPSWQVTAVAVAGMLVVHPMDLLDPGFQLTVGATVALLYGAGWAFDSSRRDTRQELRRRPAVWTRMAAAGRAAMGWLAAGLVATLAVEVALLPVAVTTFNRVTAAGLPLNLLAVPLMAVTQVAGMVTVAADTLGLPASVPGAAARFAAQALVDTSRLVDLAPWLVARVPAPSPWLVAAYDVACLGMVVAWARLSAGSGDPGNAAAWAGQGVPRVWRRRLSPAAIVLATSTCAVAFSGAAIVSGVAWPTGERPPALRVTMLDVGQGESILLETPDGAALVDAGGAPFGSSGFDIGGRVVAPALWARGIRRLAALAVTHGDPDHLGGALSVLRDFAPREVWLGVDVPGHEPSAALAREAAAHGVRVVHRRAGESFALGAARVRVLHPANPDWERRRVRNDDSVVLEVALGDVALLLTGDIGAAIEDGLVAQLTPAPTRILKVAHHGSRTSSGAALVEGWRPQLVLVSCGRGNSFGHPAPEVLARFAGVHARVLRTDRDGQVTVETDGRRVWTRTYVGG